MTDQPLISVIVPVYKVEAYLDKCISSLVGQTYENLEILLVDDGSPDASGEICDRWAAKDDRIRVIHKENGGAGRARNLALDQARGEFIAMVDSDDYIAPRMFEHLLGLMKENVDIAECEGVPAQDDHCPLDDGSAFSLLEATAEEAMEKHIREALFTQVIWNKLYRRSVIGDIRFPEGQLIDDEFFTYRVIGNARNLVHSTAKMYAYRQQPDSVMHRPFSLRRLEGVRAHEKRLEYLKERMPSLTYKASVNLFLYSQYAMQMSIKWLEEEELVKARAVIRKAVQSVTPLAPGRQNSPAENFWLILGQISFEGSCKLQNFLESRKK